MKIYLASAYTNRERLVRYARVIEKETGHTVGARWLDGTHDLPGDVPDPVLLAQFAIEDVADVVECDMLVHFVPTGPSKGSGGRHVEMGIAFAYGKRVVHVGAPENVFHYLPNVWTVKGFDALLTLLQGMPV